MDQQALSNAFMSSFPWIQDNSSEATNIQNGSSTTESTGKSNFWMLRAGKKYYTIVETINSIFNNNLCKKQRK